MAEQAAIILAAGKSTRMLSDLPKVLHEVCGRPMLSNVLSACRLAGVDRLIVVIGHGKEAVVERMAGESDITWVVQTEQKGTGHAVGCCREALSGHTGSVLVIAGDMPLVRRSTLAGLLGHREREGDALTMATTVLEDPTSYGRIIRSADGSLESIVEHRDCTEAQLAFCEVNPSYYCFDGERLFAALEKVQEDPAKGEYYLTEVVEVFRAGGEPVSAPISVPAEDAMGINSRLDLAKVNRAMQDRIQLALMEDGVTIVDPDNTWIESEATVGRDTVIEPFTFIGAGATIGEGCRLGPFVRIGAGDGVEDGSVVSASSCVGANA